MIEQRRRRGVKHQGEELSQLRERDSLMDEDKDWRRGTEGKKKKQVTVH